MENIQKKSVVLSAVKWIIEHFGVELVEWALAELRGEQTQSKDPLCPKGYYWDTTTNSCQPDL